VGKSNITSENLSDYTGIILDTSFLVAIRDSRNPFYKESNKYFQHFLDNKIPCYISVISIGEYCVKGNEDELPLQDTRTIIYDAYHAKIAGNLAAILFSERIKKQLDVTERIIIPNDVKIFAQAEANKDISHCITSDRDFKTIYESLKKNKKLPRLNILDSSKPFNEEMRILIQA
jgi:predicted nucleic acid-binding protein